MHPSWRVELGAEVISWVSEAQASDPGATAWVLAAFALLEQAEASDHPLLRVPISPSSQVEADGQIATLGAKDLVIDYILLPESRSTYVWRCALAGLGRRVTAITFR